MKKLAALLGLVLFGAGLCLAQTTIFSDDMTNFPTGWTLSPAVGWTKSSSRYYSSSYSARVDDVNPYAASQNNYMTRSVVLSGYTSATLTFSLWQYTESSYDYVYVQYYSGSTWTTAWSRSGSYQSWAQQSVTIPTTATQVRFWFKSDYSVQYEGAYVDDVVLTATGAATPTLAVSMASWSPAAAGGTSSAVSVTNSGSSSVIAYTVSSNQTWLTVSSASGSTPGSFTMTAAANTGSARTATVTVTATTSGVSGSPQTISVSQAAAAGGQNDAGTGGDAGNTLALATQVSPGSWTGCYLDATDREDYYKFNVTSGQVVKVKVTPPSSADFDLYLYNPSQTQVASSTRGTGLVDSVVYTATVSGTFYARAYEYSGTGNYSLLISVTGGTASPALAVSMTSWAPAAAGGTSSAVNVTNSATTDVISYTVSSNQTWLTVSAASGSTPGSFTMTAAANTGSSRSATVTVTATAPSGTTGSPKTITVTQAAAATPTLAISMTSWSPAAAGGTSSAVNVTNSGSSSVIAYTVSSNQTWLTVSAASGNTPGSFTMTAAANTGSARTATVTVTATTGGVANSPQTVAVSQAAGGTTGYEWTIMVFLNGDNNLEQYGFTNFNQIAAASQSSGKYRVVVQFDRATGYDATNGDWTTCKRFLVTPGMTATAANQISDLGEVDMGNPTTLSTFANWAIDNYPANHYYLVFWDHGGGWTKDGMPLKDFSNDNSSGNSISIANGEFATAMNTIKTHLGRKLDAIGWDACLMGMAEVIDISKDYADAAFVSEETEAGTGWNYTPLCNAVNSNPTISALELIKAQINGTGGTGLDTQSDIDLTKVSALNTAISAFADQLMAAKGAGYTSAIHTCEAATRAFYISENRDLWDFANRISAASVPAALVTAANNVKTAVTNAVYYNLTSSSYSASKGVAIYLPLATGSTYDTGYNSLPFCTTSWDEYIKGGTTGGSTANYIKSTATYSWDASATTATGCTGDDQAVAVNLGFSFNFYGATYTSVNICSNGFLNFGTSSTAYSPATIPNTAAPNALIAGLWRDLNPSGGGTITYYSSATKFVVSYNAVKNYSNTSTQTFQVIINSDGTIKVQWGSITTAETYVSGVENTGGTLGVSATAATNSAVLYTPPAAWSPIVEDPQANQSIRNDRSAKPMTSLLSQNMPNPVRGKTMISYQLSQPGRASLKVYNLNGQLVKTLVNTVQDIGYYDVSWNGRDEAGRTVAAGVYLYSLDIPGYSASKRMILLK